MGRKSFILGTVGRLPGGGRQGRDMRETARVYRARGWAGMGCIPGTLGDLGSLLGLIPRLILFLLPTLLLVLRLKLMTNTKTTTND